MELQNSKHIPPEESNVYKNVSSNLYQFDFFEQLNTDISHYSFLGDVFLTGDLNSRTGQKPDFVQDINLDRYIDLPVNNQSVTDIPARISQDNHVNGFGNRLLSLCKENDIDPYSESILTLTLNE
jgi:hypothetical protein